MAFIIPETVLHHFQIHTIILFDTMQTIRWRTAAAAAATTRSREEPHKIIV